MLGVNDTVFGVKFCFVCRINYFLLSTLLGLFRSH
jgi:hypothetical protein